MDTHSTFPRAYPQPLPLASHASPSLTPSVSPSPPLPPLVQVEQAGGSAFLCQANVAVEEEVDALFKAVRGGGIGRGRGRECMAGFAAIVVLFIHPLLSFRGRVPVVVRALPPLQPHRLPHRHILHGGV